MIIIILLVWREEIFKCMLSVGATQLEKRDSFKLDRRFSITKLLLYG